MKDCVGADSDGYVEEAAGQSAREGEKLVIGSLLGGGGWGGSKFEKG